MPLPLIEIRPGDIALVPFPFTDLSGQKLRPALVLFVNNEDLTVLFISSNINILGNGDIIINPDNENRLRSRSVIKITKIATISRSIVKYHFGRLEESLFMKVLKSLKDEIDHLI